MILSNMFFIRILRLKYLIITATTINRPTYPIIVYNLLINSANPNET